MLGSTFARSFGTEMGEGNLPMLRILRQEAQLTQAQLGDALGVTKRSVIRWELGDSDPVFADLKRIAAYFDVSVSYLIGEAKVRKLPTDLQPG